MKLTKLKVLNNAYKSIVENSEFKFSLIQSQENSIFPKIICGLNGSGKSNLLELVSEIFVFLFQFYSNGNAKKLNNYLPFDFEIEFVLTKNDDLQYVRIIKHTYFGLKTEFKSAKNKTISFVELSSRTINRSNDSYLLINQYLSDFDVSLDLQTINENHFDYLPEIIYVYSSGENENLSNIFLKNIASELKINSKRLESILPPKMVLINKEVSQLIFIACFFMEDDDSLLKLKKIIKVYDIKSFRITLKNINNLTDKTNDIVNRLINCSTTSLIKIEDEFLNNRSIILDYFKSSASVEVFRKNFKTSYDLFLSLYELEIQNVKPYLYKINKLNSSPYFRNNIHEEILLPADKKVFRIENLKIIKDFEDYESKTKIGWVLGWKYSTKVLDYSSLSDGEHQLFEIMGINILNKSLNALFILDEPETHLNPQWKYDYTKLMASVSNSKNSEFMITTHDPILLSGVARENILITSKDNEGASKLINPEIDMIGVNFDSIIRNVFGFESTLDSQTLNDMINRRHLILKLERNELDDEEKNILKELNGKLHGLDFTKAFFDPLNREYVENIEDFSLYKKPILSNEEKLIKIERGRRIMDKIRNSNEVH